MRTLAAFSLPLAVFDRMSDQDRRGISRTIAAELRGKGYSPADYELEAVVDRAAGRVTLAAHAIDPAEQPLQFDDQGIT